MLCVPVSTWLGVYKTEQVDLLFVPGTAWRVHLSGLKLPDEPVKNATTPIGLVAPDGAVSVTMTVHVVDWPTTTGLGTHARLVLVGSLMTVWVTIAP